MWICSGFSDCTREMSDQVTKQEQSPAFHRAGHSAYLTAIYPLIAEANVTSSSSSYIDKNKNVTGIGLLSMPLQQTN